MWCCKHVTNAGLLITPHHISELSKWEMDQENVCLPLFLSTSFKLGKSKDIINYIYFENTASFFERRYTQY
jgi:hypothetical protein